MIDRIRTLPDRIRTLPDRVHNVISAARGSLLWALLRRQRRWVNTMLMLFVAVMITSIIVASLTAEMIDRGIVDQTVPLGPYVPLIIWWATASLVIAFAMAQVTSRVTYQVEFDLRVWLYTRIQAAENLTLNKMAAGQVVTRSLTDLELVERILGIVPTLIGVVPLLIGLTVFLAILSPPMAFLAAVSLPINLWVLSRFRRRLWALSWADLNERAEVMAAIDEPVRGIRVVKAFGREAHERTLVAAVALRAYRFAMTRIRLLARYDILIKFIPYVFNAAVLAVGAGLVSNGRLSLGVFLIAFQLSQLMNLVATSLSDIASAWQYLRSAQTRLLDVLGLGARIPTEGAALPEQSSGLEIEAVDFTMVDTRVLDGFDVSVMAGELVVVTGPPSSGRSTLAAIAAGLLPVDAGVVRLDGVDLRDLDGTALRQVVRIVSEESVIFAASLRENLEMGASQHVTDAELLRALAIAGATELIDAIPGGLDGVIGDRGLTLSGGQRQRLALARALVSPPRVLILDDALAAVNPSLEVTILARIGEELPNTAVLCMTRRTALDDVAHRVVRLPDPAVADDHVAAETPLVEASAEPDREELARSVASLDVSEELPTVDDDDIVDSLPTVWWLCRHFVVLLLLVLGLLILASLGQLAPEALFGSIADVVERGTGGAYARALALVGIGVVFTFVTYAFRILAGKVSQGVVYLVRRRIFLRLSRLGIDFYDREQPGQVAARVVHDLDRINVFLQGDGFRMLVNIGQVVVGLGLIVAISTEIFSVVALMVFAILVITAVQFPIAIRAFGWARDELGRVSTKFEEDLTAHGAIISLGAQDLQLRKFVAASWHRRRARWWATTVANTYSSLIQFVGTVGATFVLYRAGNLVIAASLSIGAALSLRLLSTAATSPLALIGAQYRELLDVRVSWQRLRQPFEVDILPAESPDARTCPPLRGAVVFENVAFGYPYTGQRVLHDVSLSLMPGAVNVLVGYTGAGKSSIAKLLSRTYDPDAGRLLVDGMDLRSLNLRSYRKRLGVVPQDAFLFRGTVATNIAYGTPTAAVADIEAAARAVGADLLLSLPGGLDHPVEEEGRNLSAARRQLVALARAWLASPDILVLDEATSCLDAHLEQSVVEALARTGLTTLMITHRQQVAAQAQAIIVLQAGRVVQSGPAADVLAAGGEFDRLWYTDDEMAARLAT